MSATSPVRARPDSAPLLALAIAAQVALIALPMWAAPELGWLVGLLALALGFALFSAERTLAFGLFATIVLPAPVLMGLRLPGGLRLQEGFLLAAFFFAGIDLLYHRHLRLRRTAADVPVLCFLLAAALSLAVGYLHGNAATVIWRDVRFPLYYGAFFLATHFVSPRQALRRYAPLLLVAAAAVALSYILEFLGAIDLSVGSRFVRVARLQGLVLPLALLLLLAHVVFAPRHWSRPLLLALFAPIGLAFVLTVGRSMWAAFVVGLLCIAYMHRRRHGRRRWHSTLLVVLVLGLLAGVAFSFQRLTGAAIGAQVFERSRTLVDYGENVHVLGRLFSYAVALQSIARHPIAGNGQGATLLLLNFDEEALRFEWTRAWTVDNLYLTLAWKMGALGLLAFAWMYARLMRLAWRAFCASGDPQVRAFCAAAVAVLAGMLVLGLGNASMVNGRFALVYGVFFGLVAVVAQEAEGDADARAG